MTIRINHTSVVVDDQAKALRFYTEVLRFEKKLEIPMGEHSWITLVSPADPDGVQLVLEPSALPAVIPFRESLVADGIPFTAFTVDDVEAEHERLKGLGVEFTQPPVDHGTVVTVVLDDTCGNLIQLMEEKES